MALNVQKILHYMMELYVMYAMQSTITQDNISVAVVINGEREVMGGEHANSHNHH